MTTIHNDSLLKMKNWFHKETVGKESVLESNIDLLDAVTILQNKTQSHSYPVYKDPNLKSAVKRMEECDKKLSGTLEQFVHIYQDKEIILETLKPLIEDLENYIKSAKLVILRFSKDLQYHREHTFYLKESTEYEIWLDYLKLANCAYLVFKGEKLSSTQHLELIKFSHSISKLPNNAETYFLEMKEKTALISKIIAIGNYLEYGYEVDCLKRTIFGLPKTIDKMCFYLIEEFRSKYDNEKALNCYKHILKNKYDTGKYSVYALKEIVESEGYDSALEISCKMLNHVEEGVESFQYINFLKAQCYQGLGDIQNAKLSLKLLSQEFLTQYPVRLWLLEFYDSIGEIQNAKEVFKSINLEEIDDKTLISEEKLIIKYEAFFEESLKHKSEASPQGSDYKQKMLNVTSYIKKFDCSVTKEEFDDFVHNKDSTHLLNVKKKQDSEIKNSDDIFSLILSKAILLNNHEIIEFTLSEIKNPYIFLSLDSSGYSPLSLALMYADEKAFSIIYSYFNQNLLFLQNLPKINVENSEDYENILTIFNCPVNEDLNIKAFCTNILDKLWDSHSLEAIHDIVEVTGTLSQY